MTPETLRDLEYRARRALAAPVPPEIINGNASRAHDYRHCAQVVATYLRRGGQAKRVTVHVMRLEAMQGLLP